MKNKIFEESGHGLVWAEFVEVGCPAKKEDYFLTEKDVLGLDIVKKAIRVFKECTCTCHELHKNGWRKKDIKRHKCFVRVVSGMNKINTKELIKGILQYIDRNKRTINGIKVVGSERLIINLKKLKGKEK